jgi:hypothetical protein
MVGDGDNVSFMQNERVDWMKERVEDCNNKNSNNDDAHKRRKHGVLTWLISPHLAHLAPSILDRYYSMAKQTSKYYFMLPLSGCLSICLSWIHAKQCSRQLCGANRGGSYAS